MTTQNLTEALSALQADLPVIPKANTARVETRNGGSYSYAFADLATISREVLPRLAGLGLAWVCGPTLVDGAFVLRWELRHVSGDSITGTYPLPGNGTPQELGSAITYGRRYCLTSVVGIAPEDDDDGAVASQRPAPRKAAAPRSAPGGKPRRGDHEGPRPITEPMVKRLQILLEQGGITDRAQKLRYCENLAERPLSSSKDLTFEEGRLIMATLEEAAQDTHGGRPDEV